MLDECVVGEHTLGSDESLMTRKVVARYELIAWVDDCGLLARTC